MKTSRITKLNPAGRDRAFGYKLGSLIVSNKHMTREAALAAIYAYTYATYNSVRRQDQAYYSARKSMDVRVSHLTNRSAS